MNNSLLKNMDKSLGIASFKKNDINSGIKYFDSYLSYLQDCIDSNSNNETFTIEKNKTIELYKKILLEIAKKSYAEKNWLICARCCQLLIKYNFSDPEIYKNAAHCFSELEEPQTALSLLEVYKKKVPDDPDLDVCFADCYLALDKDKYADKALELYKTYLESHPEDPKIYNAIGNVYATVIDCNSEDVERQLYYFNKALSYSPNSFSIMRNIHLSYMQKGDIATATEQYEKIYQLYKDRFTSDQFFDYAAFQIHIGNFKKGWSLLDHRFTKNVDRTFYPDLKRPLWDGLKNISKKTLLVFPEQGIGDVIMYIRFVEYLKSFAQKVIAMVPNELYHLFKDSDLGYEIYPVSYNLNRLTFDYHIPLISIPRIYQISPNNIPKKEGYLTINPIRQKDFRESFLNTDKLKVGVCFEGAAGTKVHHRNIDWSYIKFLAKNPNVQLYCFKKELTEDYFKEIDESLDIVCLGKYFNTFADTAAAIKNMDLMISTDNVILNLSGALGVKTYGLFNKNREYRWYGVEEGKMIWYDSVIPFMPAKLNDWEPVLEKIAQSFDDLSSSSTVSFDNVLEKKENKNYTQYYSDEELLENNENKWV